MTSTNAHKYTKIGFMLKINCYMFRPTT